MVNFSIPSIPADWSSFPCHLKLEGTPISFLPSLSLHNPAFCLNYHSTEVERDLVLRLRSCIRLEPQRLFSLKSSDGVDTHPTTFVANIGLLL